MPTPEQSFSAGNLVTRHVSRLLLDVVKTNGCFTCHQLGNKATRTLPKDFADMKPEEAWARRVMSGQSGQQMIGQLTGLGPLAPQN